MIPRRSSIHCYVDDPAIHVYGNEALTHRALARLVGSWLALGFRMAFRKAVLCGFRGVVTWTSIRFTVLPDAIVLQIKEQIVEDVLTQAMELLAKNKIHEYELRQYLGRANCIAGLMIAWRPFLGMLWAALSNKTVRGTAGPGKLWTKQVKTPLPLVPCLHQE